MAASVPTGITSFPNELLFAIADECSRSQLNNLLRTCKRIEGALNPELYRRDRVTDKNSALVYSCVRRRRGGPGTLKHILEYAPPDTKLLQSVLRENDPLLNGTLLKSMTPLLLAAAASNESMVTALLDNGADVNQSESVPGVRPTLWYPIHFAVAGGMNNGHADEYRCRTVLTLLERGADPNQLSLLSPEHSTSDAVITPLHLAIQKGADSRIINSLIRAGALPTRETYKATPNQRYSTISPLSHLLETCAHEYDMPESTFKIARKFIRMGAGSGEESTGYTRTGDPLLFQCLSAPREVGRWTSVITSLVNRNPGMVHCTLRTGETAILRFLRAHLGWEPSVNFDSRWYLKHEKAYDMAKVSESSNTIILWLQKQGVDINQGDRDGITPLHVASGMNKNFRDVFEFLIRAGANVHARTKDGRTVLHTALQGDGNSDSTIVQRLIDLGVPKNAVDQNGRTFLHHMCAPAHTPHIWVDGALKVYSYKDFDFRDKNGNTPRGLMNDIVGRAVNLHFQIQKEHREWEARQRAEKRKEATKRGHAGGGFVRGGNSVRGKTEGGRVKGGADSSGANRGGSSCRGANQGGASRGGNASNHGRSNAGGNARGNNNNNGRDNARASNNRQGSRSRGPPRKVDTSATVGEWIRDDDTSGGFW